MATILFNAQEFKIAPDLTAGSVLAAACLKYAELGDVNRFKLFDENGRDLRPSEFVGARRLSLCDVQTLRDFREVQHQEVRHAIAAK
jgi:hypothetical protein